MTRVTSCKPTSSTSGQRPGGYGQAVLGGRLTSLLYVLMRDGDVGAGRMWQLVDDIAEHDEETAFSNDWLAAFAVELESRLRGETPELALASGHAAIRLAQERG